MKRKEIKRRVSRAGCYFLRDGGNHEIWWSPITNQEFPISHKSSDFNKSELHAIEKESGVRLIFH